MQAISKRASNSKQGIIYEVCRTQMENAELGRYTSYGIRGRDKHQNQVVFIEDITLAENKLEKLVATINRGQLAPWHLKDVVSNFIRY